MARTVRTYWNDEGRLVKDHRDGRTGWVYSPRTRERIAKKAERRAAIAEAWADAAEAEEAEAIAWVEDREAERDAWMMAYEIGSAIHQMMDRLGYPA